MAINGWYESPLSIENTNIKGELKINEYRQKF